MKTKTMKVSLLFWSFVLLLVAGCNSGGSEETATEGEEIGGEDEREVSILYIGDDFWVEQAEEFEETTGITVHYESIPFTSLHDTMFTLFTGGSDEYDVIHVRDDWASEFAAQGFLEPLDDYITDEMKEDFQELSFENLSYEGSIYGMPRYLWLYQFYYNEAMFEEAGVEEVPTTLDELIETAKQIQNNTDLDYAYAEAYGQNFAPNFFTIHLRAEGGEYWDYVADKPTFNTAEGVTALQRMVDMNLEHGIINPLSFEFNGTGPLSEVFVQGQFAMTMNTPHVAGMSDNSEVSSVVGEVDVDLIPGSVIESAGYAETGGMAIPANAKNKEEAFEFITFATSFDQQKKMALSEVARIPAHLGALNDEEVLSTHPHFESVNEQIEYPHGLFKHVRATEINDLVARELVQALRGEKSSEDALNDAEEAVLNLLN